MINHPSTRPAQICFSLPSFDKPALDSPRTYFQFRQIQPLVFHQALSLVLLFFFSVLATNLTAFAAALKFYIKFLYSIVVFAITLDELLANVAIFFATLVFAASLLALLLSPLLLSLQRLF